MTLVKVISALALLTVPVHSSPFVWNELAHISSIGRVDGDYRLPNNTVPTSYVIRLTPYIVVDDFTFDGEATINFQVLQATSTITLHTNALTYNESLTTIVSDAGEAQVVTNHAYVTDEHFLNIEVQNELPVGNYTLHLTFVGILDNDMYGFYRSSYTNELGETVWLATTQFEPTSARRAFPCWDEPALKATFDIGIKHDPSLHALSNMPISENYTDPTDGKTWTLFETTPLISTYLVAFVVSDFTSIKNFDETYNVWSRSNAITQAQYAYDIGILELAELEEHTNVQYSLPKMDQISIPDFSAGAMENWGLVTYRESYFFYTENVSTLSTKQSIATVISHEFAHQWYGNLVSPLWWKYLWLNEGFATYYQYYTTEVAEDNWRLMDQFVIRVQQNTAFVTDASATSHPMNQDVASPTEIRSIFDNISYSKAACVIRMMSHFLTETVFKEGLTLYLNNKAFSSATSDDLFEALHEVERAAYILPLSVTIKEIMDTWVEQMGYPVLTLTRNYTTGTTEITQERFLLGDASTTDTHDYKWWIPINWASQASLDFSSTVASDWIRSQDASIIISGFDTDGWVIFNVQQSGYYRVNYDERNWGLLASYLNSDNYLNIHVINRAALIDDAFNLARTDRLSYSIVLNLVVYLQREIDYVPWYSAFGALSYLNRAYANTEQYELFRSFFASLTSTVFNAVGVDETSSDDHLTRFHRANVINYACNFGLESCRLRTEERLLAWLDDSTANAYSPDLLTNSVCAGLRSANATTWNLALNKYLTSESTTESTALLAGLGCSEDETIVNNWLNAIISPATGLTTAVSSTAFINVYQGSPYNVDRAFDFLVNNLASTISYFGSNTSVQTFVLGISYRMTTAAQLEKLNTFIAAQSDILSAVSAVAVGYVESNIEWNAANGEDISTWLVTSLIDSENGTTAASSTEDAEGDNSSVATTTTAAPSTEDAEGDNSSVATTTTAAPSTEDAGGDNSSAATPSINFFAAILALVCLVKFD